MNKIQPIVHSDAMEILFRNLQLPFKPIKSNDMIQRYTIFAEYLRCSLQHLSLGPLDKKVQSVYIRRLFNVVVTHLEGIWPELKNRNLPLNFEDIEIENYHEMSGLMKWTLLNLSLIGDCSDVGKGFWLPTPIRMINLPNSDYFTVIGCVEFKQLRNILPKVESSGIGRIIKKDDIPNSLLGNKNVWQEFNNWVGWLPRDIMDWTRSECETVQKYGSISSSTFNEFEVYLSNNSFVYNTNRFWLHYESFSSYGISENVMLCRTLSYPRSYFLGVFEKGILKKERVLKGDETIVWIKNGIRLLHKSKNTATWLGNKLKLIQVPQAIDRFLSVLSYRVPSKSGFPRYYIPSKYKEYTSMFLSKFGFSIIDRGAKNDEVN